jgi:hypothetical protein
VDFGRLKTGEWIIAASAVVLGVSLFLPWFELPEMYFNRSQGVNPDELNLDFSGWEILSIIDILLMALAVFAVLVVLRAANTRSASDGLFGEGLLTPVALGMSIVVLVRVLNMPGDLEPLAPVVDRGIGAWLALFSTIGLVVGALTGMRNEWVGSRARYRDHSRAAPGRRRGRLTFTRLLRADWVAFAAALALLLVMSLDWYSSAAGDEARRIERISAPQEQDVRGEAKAAAEKAEKTAWQADRTLDRVILVGLLATILFAIGAGYLRAAGRRFEPPRSPSALLAGVATGTGLVLGVHVLVLAGDDAGTRIKAGAPIAAILLGVIALAAVSAVRAEESGKAWRSLEREAKAPVGGTT